MKFGQAELFQTGEAPLFYAKGYFLEHTFEKNRELLFSKPAGLCISTRNDALLSRNGNIRVDFFQENGIIVVNLL